MTPAENESEERPLCSVLSTAINHVMMPPTPLEPGEFQDYCQQQQQAKDGTRTTTTTTTTTRVPVIRIFGPIVRGDAPSGVDPVQSACLYIHGAFPYLLARPVLAGPDGSLHHSSHHHNMDTNGTTATTTTSSGHLDWDNVEAVERLAPIIHKRLEDMLQAPVIGSSGNNGDLTTKKKKKEATVSTTKFIRKVSVVTGRGFYTFCPGPAAPFLRVEYYDPNTRWKMKMNLERGLELPLMYHPDPQQYDAVAMAPSVDSSQLGVDPLRFHCYEAHIPYTMQFFKDWNLAGMSYIHLEEGKFRLPLPSGVRRRWPDQNKNGGGEPGMEEEKKLAFIVDNTPLGSIWEQETSQQSLAHRDSGDNESSHAITSSSHPLSKETADANVSTKNDSKDGSPGVDMFWSKKATSCDIEIDVDVSSIMNVRAIMTALPEDKAEGENIHWRAVPSLREVWQEERRRMAKLLPPKDDFLSKQQSLSSTSNGKSDQGSGSKQQTPPFTLSVKKDASTPGSRLAVKGMKRLTNLTYGLEEDFKRALGQIIDRHSVAVSQVDRRLKMPSLDGEGFSRGAGVHEWSQLTPSNDEALDALGGMASQFDGTFVNSGIGFEPPQGSQSQNTDDVLELRQTIKHGEGFFDGSYENNTESLMNPEIIEHYDTEEDESDIEEEDEMDESELERVLTELATQIDEPDRGRAGPAYVDNEYGSGEDSISGKSSVPSEDDEAEDPDDDTVAHNGEIYLQPSDTPPDTPTQYAPSRVSLRKGSKSLLQIPPSSQQKPTPSWLSHSAAYKSFREQEGLKANQTWFPEIPKEGLSIQPSKPPPCRDEVVFWYRRKTKRVLNTETISGNKKPTPGVSVSGKEQASANLHIDGNSGRLVANIDTGVTNEGVEEVQWEPSQSQCLSLSQGQSGSSQSGVIIDEFGDMTANFTAASLSGTQTQHKTAAGVYSTTPSEDSKGERRQPQALRGMQNQGGRLVVEGGGQLKARTRPSQSCTLGAMGSKSKTRRESETFDSRYLPTPFTMVSVEVHVQCRKDRASVTNSTTIAMTPVPERDQISAVCYVFCRDPGGGGALQFLERGCLYVQLEAEKSNLHDSSASYFDSMKSSIPEQIMGVHCPLSLEAVKDERQLLLRLASIIRWKDPDMMISWDTQGAGLGYIIERGANLGREIAEESKGLDMVRLLGRLPATDKKNATVEGAANFFDGGSGGQNGLQKDDGNKGNSWEGSGLGNDWDERVGAGSAAASITGRLVFSGYKIIAEEVKHPNNSYLPAMVSTVLGKRIPHHDELMLTNWYAIKKGRERWRVLHHRLVQGTATLLLFEALDIVGRAGEAARLSGVEFSQSFPGIRGTQYKVEGVLLRALKSLNSEERGSKRGKLKSHTGTTAGLLSEESISQTQSPWKKRRQSASGGAEPTTGCGYFFYSPSLQDTNKQEALEMQALTLEPQSGHHTDPVIVCDFTALYPSLIIAYNLCYSTCAGRLSYHTTRREMLRDGRTTGRVGPFLYSESRTATVLKHHMKSLKADNNGGDGTSEKDRAYAAPTGTIYVSESVVRGVLPQVLDEILSTRAMLKKAAKEYKRLVPNLAPSILRQLEARQLALKYVANVTYGYTSATFSGRCAMPLLADTIVDCGRRTLTNAINLANTWAREEGGKWQNCEVLYGDTDSIFIKLPGRSVEEAFDFGEQFCREVTAENPPPVQLKLEKVYIGSILQTKKKYLGMKLESKDAKSPEFEAKGIETIRRDQCTLTKKILQGSLITLFRHGLNAVKNYLFRQWSLILSGRVPISDFIITGRVRSKYRGGKQGPVQAALFRRLREADPGLVMRNKERLAYVICATPGVNVRLRDSVVTPMELLEQWDAYTIHTAYYITKHVNAALQRCFGLAPHHIKISDWYAECPKPRRRIHFWPLSGKKTGSSAMISQYFGSDICSLCGIKCMAEGSARAVVCSSCRQDDVNSFLVATRKLQTAQSKAHELAKRCSACNLCFEDGSTFAGLVKDDGGNESAGRRQKAIISNPLAACTCTDCPTTYERHRLREENLEAEAICKALGIQ